jgi:SAM-dependent methyltransferase
LTGLLRLAGSGTVAGVDLVMDRTRGVEGVAGDCCVLPFADGSFSFISCISTIEHIAHDNTRYGSPASRGSAGTALRELARVLDPNGRLAVTVPYGRSESHGWFEQFDDRSWRTLVAGVPLEVVEEEVFGLGRGGWHVVNAPEHLANIAYGSTGPAAGAVLCALMRPS